MIKRYTSKEMDDFWTDSKKYSYWLKVEIAVLYARMKLEQISVECYEAISKHASFNLQRIEELEEIYGHDMIAFVECVREKLRQAGVKDEWADEIHRKLTSYDIEDTALMLMLLKAGNLILDQFKKLEESLLKKATENKWTLMNGRTHGQYAEPTTFGHLLLLYAFEIERARNGIVRAMDEDLRYGKISGVVGTYAGGDSEIEKIVCEQLNLKPAQISSQILQRDRIANFISALAIAAASIEQIARTFWGMMKSEIGELQEPRKKTQRGSSAMPQKKNPITIEQLYGLPRIVRANLSVAIENIATLDYRDISQSGPERIILPDTTILLVYMAKKMTNVVDGLVVFPDRMKENLDNTYGTWAGQRIRYALVEKGIPDKTAYDFVQKITFAATSERKPLIIFLNKTPISETDQRKAIELIPDIDNLLDAMAYIKNGIEMIFARFIF